MTASSAVPKNNVTLIGCQEPRIKREPKYRQTDGADACELAASYGMVADTWQELVLNCWLGRGARLKWAAKECGLMVPRQNGKNGILEIRELYGIAILGEHILHTAHQVKTAREAFVRLCGYFENPTLWPELTELVRDIRKTNGQESIELIGGGSVRFVARSRASARGFTADVLVLDEAQELTNEQIEALQPTLAAAPLKNSQIIMTGTPPGPTAPGEVLGKWRTNAIEKNSSVLAWHEWSVEDIGDTEDKSRWYQTNPALGKRISLAAIESELNTMSEDGFARERLGWWSKEHTEHIIGLTDWQSCAISAQDVPDAGKLAFGIKFAPNDSYVSCAICLKPKSGKPHIELVAHRSRAHGIAWLVNFLVLRWRKCTQIAIDGANGATALAEALFAAGVRKQVVWLSSTKEVITAASMFTNAISEHNITHFDQDALNASVGSAKKRLIGTYGGWGFGSIDETDITPTEACSLAYWAAETSKRDPDRKLRVG